MKAKNQSIVIILLALIAYVPMFGQTRSGDRPDREKWLAEMREYKHDYLAKELELTKEQQREFFPLYDGMEDEVERVNTETRILEARLNENPDAGDLELENGARTIYEQKRAEGQIEMTYFEKFKEILTPRQLLKLRNAERKWQQQLINHHRRMKRGPQK